MRALQVAATALRRHRWVGLGLTLCLVLALGGSLADLLPGRAHAATITVSTCTEAALDAAVAAASPGDTIHFGCSGTITLSATLDITSDLTLDGTGQNVTLDGNHSVQVLSVASGVHFTLNHLTVANGLAAGVNGTNGGSGGDAWGGGLFTPFGTLTLTNCTFTSNIARGGAGSAGSTTNTASALAGPVGFGGFGFGGGLYIGGGMLTLRNCVFTDNSAQGGAGASTGAGSSSLGGGLHSSYSTISATNSTFSSNTAQGGAGGSGGNALGGGFTIAGGTVSLINSAVTGNTAQGGSSDPGVNGGNGSQGGAAFGGGGDTFGVSGGISLSL